jgi:fumarylpyruvate hydrolase
MTSRRDLLKGAVVAAAAPAAAEAAQAGLAFPAPQPTTLPIQGSSQRFPVRRIYCVGRNYLAHVRELGNDEREPPFFFAKHTDMIVQNGASVRYPALTSDFHHELELVVAMKSGGADIPVERALDHVYGYAVGLDMTRRDRQREMQEKRRPWEVAKSFEQSAPCSAVVPASAVGHLKAGRIQLTVNGATRQDSDLADMIWDVAEIVHHLSTQAALAAGDLIYTGTPDGVGPVARGDRLVGRIDKLPDLVVTVA